MRLKSQKNYSHVIQKFRNPNDDPMTALTLCWYSNCTHALKTNPNDLKRTLNDPKSKMISFRRLSSETARDHRCFFQIVSKIHVAQEYFWRNVSKVQIAMIIFGQSLPSLFQFIFLQKWPWKSCFWTFEMSWAFNLRVFQWRILESYFLNDLNILFWF